MKTSPHFVCGARRPALPPLHLMGFETNLFDEKKQNNKMQKKNKKKKERRSECDEA